MAAAIVLPAAIAAGHAAYSYGGWTIIVGRDDPLAGISYVPSLVLAATYLLAVFVGRRLMQSRPALNPFYAMQIYNVYEAALSAYMTWLFVSETFLAGRSPFAAPVDRSAAGSKLAFALWLNYTSKVRVGAGIVGMLPPLHDRSYTTHIRVAAPSRGHAACDRRQRMFPPASRPSRSSRSLRTRCSWCCAKRTCR